MPDYDTLLKLASDRLKFIASSANWTRDARHQALAQFRAIDADIEFRANAKPQTCGVNFKEATVG